MGKNIVICSDGTGNTAMKGRGTNVFKLYEAVDIHHEATKQVTLYDDGVGTQTFNPLKLLSGAIGLGLSKNVIQLYTELAHLYNPGDNIYLFGFSRGAFTVRTLAGLIYQCGILDHDTEQELRNHATEAYYAFRCRKLAILEQYFCNLIGFVFPNQCCKKASLHEVREKYALRHKTFKTHRDSKLKIIPPIKMIGVWDTVSAMGFPVKEISDFINRVFFRFKFENQDLADNVNRACHALSIDDQRKTFHPLLWNENENTLSVIEQVWFAGVHANVGGGYPKHGLSLVTLDWMMYKANEQGLIFNAHDQQTFHQHRNVNDKLYDSRSGIKSVYRYEPRDIGPVCEQHGVTPRIHLSAFWRVAQSTEGYAPGNIPNTLEVVDHAESSALCQKVQSLLKDSLNNTPSLLSKVRGKIKIRKITHFFILAGLFFLVGVYLVSTSASTGFWAALIQLFSLNGLIGLITYTLKHYWWLIIIAVALYVLGKRAETTMKNLFSEFYNGILRPLRIIFELSNEKIKK